MFSVFWERDAFGFGITHLWHLRVTAESKANGPLGNVMYRHSPGAAGKATSTHILI